MGKRAEVVSKLGIDFMHTFDYFLCGIDIRKILTDENAYKEYVDLMQKSIKEKVDYIAPRYGIDVGQLKTVYEGTYD